MVLVTTRFVNTLTQEPVAIEYLPIGEIKGLRVVGADPEEALQADTAEMVFEPSPEDGPRLPAGTVPEHLSLLRAAERQGERAERAHGVDEERQR